MKVLALDPKETEVHESSWDGKTWQEFWAAAIVWSDREPEILQVHPRDLPWNVLPEMVELAIDVDGDHQVDALKVNFCCKIPPVSSIVSIAVVVFGINLRALGTIRLIKPSAKLGLKDLKF
ncbi:MAG: hypothetical protein HC773_30090 [Scytonema sp. CRU_2_7]|nr:hypothetical protein [Scytonema sp. CRU_2_7]